LPFVSSFWNLNQEKGKLKTNQIWKLKAGFYSLLFFYKKRSLIQQLFPNFFKKCFIIVFIKQYTMKKNKGRTDRTVRTLVMLVILYLYFTEQINSKIAVIALSLSSIFIVASFISFCPPYLTFGISTRKNTVES